MIPTRGLVQTVRGWFGKPMADASTDPMRFFGTLYALPNPDPILREMGVAEKVYFSIMADAHVIGDVRSIRGNFRAFDWRLNAGDEKDPKSVAARDLCEEWMRTTPPGGRSGSGLQLDWQEVMWQMTASIFTGYRVHEVIWDLVNGKVLPVQVIDRPNRRIKFDAYGDPLLISVGNMIGAPIDQPSQFAISRHMPDSVNPYGVALLSSCFWPWTFKTGGWRYFVKYCERHGLPWPIGRYPVGTSDADQNKLADALANMMEAGYVVAPEGTGLELLVPTTNSAGTLPQQNLIDLCNREMSKALTGQAMVSELHGTGARAASETASKRQDAINQSDRDIAVASMGQIFKWITAYNFGPDVSPPALEFFQESHAGLERAKTYQVVAEMGARPSKAAMLDELGIPQAENDDDALLPAQAEVAGPVGDPPEEAPSFSGVPGFRFAQAAGLTEDQAQQLAALAADRAIEDRMLKPVYDLMTQYEREGKSLAEFAAALSEIVGVMDQQALQDVVSQALQFSILQGAATQAD